jgi:hypothetical protein
MTDEEHKEYMREYAVNYRREHPEKVKETKRKYATKHPEEIRKYEQRGYRHWVLRYYGISQKEYDAMLEKQGGKCTCCGRPNSGRMKKNGEYDRMVIDHDHKTGKVRGLLCVQCNLALGVLDDSKERVELLLEYIQRHDSSPDA